MKALSKTPTFFTLLKAVLIGDALIVVLTGVLTWFWWEHTLDVFGHALLWAGVIVGVLGILVVRSEGPGTNNPARDLDRLQLYQRYANVSPINREPMGDDYKFVIAMISAGALLALIGFMLYTYF